MFCQGSTGCNGGSGCVRSTACQRGVSRKSRKMQMVIGFLTLQRASSGKNCFTSGWFEGGSESQAGQVVKPREPLR